MATIKKKRIIDFIESFPNIKREAKHGICYNIYNDQKIQLNLRPILITRDKKNEFGDNGLKHIADAFGIDYQFLKQLLIGEKTKEDYEHEVLRNKKI